MDSDRTIPGRKGVMAVSCCDKGLPAVLWDMEIPSSAQMKERAFCQRGQCGQACRPMRIFLKIPDCGQFFKASAAAYGVDAYMM